MFRIENYSQLSAFFTAQIRTQTRWIHFKYLTHGALHLSYVFSCLRDFYDISVLLTILESVRFE